MKKFYVTTSIPYANAKPHIGHTQDALYADVLSRHYRSLGYDVILEVGLDEHGQKLYQKAQEKGVAPEKWLEVIRPYFLEFEKLLNVQYDVYTRTSDKAKHFPVAVEMWKRAQASGDIYKKPYKGLYCVGCEEFKNPDDLVDGKCPDHLTVPEQIEEENYFFKLSKYEGFLKEHFEKNPDFVYPKNFYNEAYQMIVGGLEDISISRPKERLPWGVPVPGDEDHVMYVWFDALTNYLTAIGFPTDMERFEKYWPADLEIVGKDNNRWHTILWPAMLHSAGLDLPQKALVHSYIMGKGGVKMSKTIGNVIDPVEIIKKYGTDAFRYYLLTQIPMDKDGVFDEERFREVFSSDLSNDLGNLVQRTISMINRYETVIDKDSKVPWTSFAIDPKDVREKVSKDIEGLEFREAMNSIWTLVRMANVYIEKYKPWELAKNDQKKLQEVLQIIYESIALVAELLSPFMPETSEKIKSQLESLKPEPLFPRLDDASR